MPLKIKVAAKRAVKGAGDEQKPIFERYKENALTRLTSTEMEGTEPNTYPSGSLPQARGRFLGEGIPYEKPTASYNWKVTGPAADPDTGKYLPKKDQVPGKMERVAVHIKAGSRMVALLEDPEDGKVKKSIEIPSENVVPVLQAIEGLLRNITKDSEDGKIFHQAAIIAAEPRFKKGKDKPYNYCAKTDLYVIHENKAAQKEWEASNG